MSQAFLESLESRALFSGGVVEREVARPAPPLPAISRAAKAAVAPFPVVAGTYRGTATTKMSLYDGFNLVPLNAAKVNVIVTVRKPINLVAEREREANPINLLVASTNRTGKWGDILLTSAAIFRTPISEARILLQHWKIVKTAKGFSAKLTDTHAQESAASNMVWGPALVVPGQPQHGSVLAGYSLYDARFGTQYQARLVATTSADKKTLKLTLESWGQFGGTNLAKFTTTMTVKRA